MKFWSSLIFHAILLFLAAAACLCFAYVISQLFEFAIDWERLILVVIAAVGLTAALFLLLQLRRPKNQIFEKLQINRTTTLNQNAFTTPGETVGVVTKMEPADEPAPKVSELEEYKDLPIFEEINRPLTGAQQNFDWLIVRTSLPGKQHTGVTPPIPCQDSNHYQVIGENCGVAVVCDGAGSKRYSHYGSLKVSEACASVFSSAIKQQYGQLSEHVPSAIEWRKLANDCFVDVRNQLLEFAIENEIEFSLLGCTAIVLVHGPKGILAAHIGDGRAASRNALGDWTSAIKPHKGEEANQTVFITSQSPADIQNVLETNVIEGVQSAFVLMSDGCESHSFEVNLFDATENKYHDPNRPFPKFFEPILSTIRSSRLDGAELPDIADAWRRFIASGNQKLSEEPDDKTMLIGVNLSIYSSEVLHAD